MERSGDDVELVNALRDFINEINLKSHKGEIDKPMAKSLVGNLAQFFKEKSEELKRLV